MPPQPAVPQEKALIKKAKALGVPIDDLLTADGEEIAWKADKDFNTPINGVLVEFHKGDPIRQRHLITALRNGRCPATSLESELWQRLTAAQATHAQPEVRTKEEDAGATGRSSKGAATRLAAPPPGRLSARSFWEREAAKGAGLMRANAPHTKVFIVHGHDDEAREAVARFIEKLGFEAVILHERPNKGRTIITKFREEAVDVGFAVVLMTPDDVGGAAPFATGQLRPRARQNVVFELGFFIGALRPERVAALVRGDIERPSDFDGVVYISLDNASWKTELARELEAAGYEIDWKKAAGA